MVAFSTFLADVVVDESALPPPPPAPLLVSGSGASFRADGDLRRDFLKATLFPTTNNFLKVPSLL